MVRVINKLKSKKGFTLIELIVVLAVLSVIMSIAVPRFVGVQEAAELKADEVTLAMLARSAELYFAQNEAKDSVKVEALDISDVKFKSDKYDGYDDSDLVISRVSDGSVTIKSGSLDTSKTLYPIN